MATETQAKTKLVDNSRNEAGDPNAVIAAFAEDSKPKIPEKFQGKSPEEIANSYLELERLHGKQAQELGELRKLTDAYIKSQLEASERGQKVNNHTPDDRDNTERTLNIDDSDPETAKARKLLEAELAPYKQELIELKKEKFINKLSTKHNDFEQIVQDKQFQDWVMESPVRVELFKKADLNFDFSSADELFSIWKERSGKVETAKAEREVDETTNAAFKNSHMETTSRDDASKGRTYRRVDIIELMRSNPERYRALEPEIRKAYAEGRVI